MRCPFCHNDDTRVVDSRLVEDGSSVRRRRECPACGERWSTFETAELKLPVVAKSDGRREPFDEHKLRTSLERALQKRPVHADAIERAMRAIFTELRQRADREVPSRQVGELVMRELKKLDQVAYVRFASVYRRFEDVQAFREEVERLERDLPDADGLQLPLLEERGQAGDGGVPTAGSPEGGKRR